MDPITAYETRHAPYRFVPGYEIRGLADLFQAPDGTVAAHPEHPHQTYTLGTDEQGRYVTVDDSRSAYVATLRQSGMPREADHRFPTGPLTVTHSVIDQ